MWRKRFSAHSTSAFQLYASLSSSCARTHIRNSSSVREGGGGRSEVVGIPPFLNALTQRWDTRNKNNKSTFLLEEPISGDGTDQAISNNNNNKQEWKEWCTLARKVKGAKLNSAIDWKQNWKKKGSIKGAASIATMRIKRLLIRSNTHTQIHKHTHICKIYVYMPYCEEETKRTRKEGLTREKEKKNEMTAIKREWGGNKSEGAKKGHNSLAQVSGGKRARYREKGRRKKKLRAVVDGRCLLHMIICSNPFNRMASRTSPASLARIFRTLWTTFFFLFLTLHSTPLHPTWMCIKYLHKSNSGTALFFFWKIKQKQRTVSESLICLYNSEEEGRKKKKKKKNKPTCIPVSLLSNQLHAS